MTFFFEYLSEIIKIRLTHQQNEIQVFPSFSINPDENGLANFIVENQLNFEEIIVILLALVPHIQPDFFDKILIENLPKGGDFTEFGGIRGTNHRGIIPTGETALYVLAGNELEKRLALYELFDSEHFFSKNQILTLEELKNGEPRMSGKIILSPEYIELFTTGKISAPQFGNHFPAQKIETQLNWEDIILSPETHQQIKDIENWVNHFEKLKQNESMKKYLKTGYRALFYGPPGTGKTLTATLLGKFTDKEVYKIDLSLVVSKYIGETEKNLGQLFDKAKSKNWILFFDEADALFGKRTETRDSHDRYANQQVAYLLQKIEDFPGLVILATNLKSNIDEAFARRFQSIIHFPMPNPKERLALWEKYFPSDFTLLPENSLKEIAERYELSGAAILNVIQLCILRAMRNQTSAIEVKDLIEAIRLEFQKEGKMIV